MSKTRVFYRAGRHWWRCLLTPKEYYQAANSNRTVCKPQVLCMQETHRGPGAVRPRVRGMNLVAEIAHEQYGSALFIRDSCICESTSTSSTDNIDIIQATLNGVTVNSNYKPPNQAFDFQSSTTDTPLQVIIGDFNSHITEWGYRSTNDDGTLVERWCDANSLTLTHGYYRHRANTW